MHKYLRPLLDFIMEGKIDPSFVIPHRLKIDDARRGYSQFNTEKDNLAKN